MATPKSPRTIARSGLPVRVFKVYQDIDHFQCFRAKDPKLDPFEDLLHGKSWSSTWSPPSVYLDSPKLKRGDFYQSGSNYMIANPKATDALRTLFEEAGELLPLPFQGEKYYVLNVTKCVDCLDQEKTGWSVPNPSGSYRGWIVHYVFMRDRLPDSAIFKIPEYSGREIFTIEGLREPESEFREIVRREGLKGLQFKQVWSSEQE